MKFYSFFLVLLIFVFACGKKQTTITVSGKISDGSLLGGENGTTVIIKAAKVESGVYNSNYVEIASTSTDSKGNYSLEVEVEKVSGYRFVVRKTNYFDVEEDIRTETFEGSDAFSKDFTIYPVAVLRLEVNNITPQTIDDEIRYRFTNIEQECKTCCNNDVVIGTGPDYSSNSECDVRGQKMYILNWVVTKKGNQHLYTDSVLAEAFKTTTYKINY